MKRFHVHLHVESLAKSVGFYSKLFATEPARLEEDYAKWMLEDPPLNFAISVRGTQAEIDHLGIQTDDATELAAMKSRAEAAAMTLLDEGETTCCYARSQKHWVTDPQGIAWEHFHTLADLPVFREDTAQAATGSACCAPTQAEAVASADAATCCASPPRGKAMGMLIKSSASCC